MRRGWRCFFCDEFFTDETSAREHFGATEGAKPGCMVKGKIMAGAEHGLLIALRRAESDLAAAYERIHAESVEGMKAMREQAARHSAQMRNAEQLGYERGLRDGIDYKPPTGITEVPT